MATFNQLMEAAGRAHTAGDANAARALVQAAQGIMRQPSQRQADSATGQEMAMQPPTLEGGALQATPPRPDRFGDTISAAVEGPVAATKFYAGRTVEPGRNPLQRAGDAGLTALNAAGAGIAFGAGVLGETFGGSPTNERKLARDLMMAGTVAVPELAGVSTTTRAAATSARAAERLERPPSRVEAGARGAGDLGITPSLGMTGKTGAMTAATLEKIPGSGGVIARDIERAVGEIEGEFNRIVSTVAQPRSASGAGDVLQSGLMQFRDRFKARAKVLFDEVASNLPPGTRVSVDNTVSAAADAKQWFSQNPELARTLGLNQWDNVLSEAAQNGMTWKALSDFRTTVGDSIGKITGPLASQGDGRLKSLYRTLTEDMEAAARAAGPDALRSWERATNYYRAGAERISRSLDKTIKADSPERAFEAFTNMAKDGRATADVRRMLDIKKSLSRDDWNEVSISIVDRLGNARAGVQNAEGTTFSPGTFLTEWNKMSPEAKRILLPEATRDELNKLAAVAERAKAAGAERNVSNTGTIVAGGATGASFYAAPITTALVIGTVNIASRSMTNPIFLRALNKAARGDVKDLERMAGGKGPFAQDAATVLRLSAAQSAVGADAANANTRPVRAINQPF